MLEAPKGGPGAKRCLWAEKGHNPSSKEAWGFGNKGKTLAAGLLFDRMSQNVGKSIYPTELKQGMAAGGEAKRPESNTLFLRRALP